MLHASPDRLLPGKPYPLGATHDGLGVNFAVFSANAQQVDLCIFDTGGRKEIARIPLPECTNEVWHGYLPHAGPGLQYGLRAHGPYEPERGHRFNPNKLLLDPYARELSGPLKWSDALFGYRLNAPRSDLSFDRRDSAPAMPRAIVSEDNFNWAGDVRPNVPWAKTVIYEAHVRGVSIGRDDIRPHQRGTFAALSDVRFIEHLQRLGVTTLELLPVHAFVQDRFLIERGLRNYWGYSTLSFFAPEPGYLSGPSTDEIRTAVRRLHAAGIEVILDVVFNHTAGGSELGPTISLRGLDNASYFRLVPGNERYYINDTGCGNTLNVPHPRVLQLVLDSLRYWATSYRIDGFRFDLGVTLGREGTGFDPGAGFFDAILQDPVLSQLKLISEPWDLGPGGYQLGNHPPPFAEWNDQFRDGVRRFWRGDVGQRSAIAAKLAGSAELFNKRWRKPWASINFIASHDGFTLQDIVSYNEKHNEANKENGNDGHSENYSANWGVEGPTEDAGILEVREKVKRAMLATLFFSQGTPMLLGGDEFSRTQDGNNNAYCQDNEISWFDWDLTDKPQNQVLIDFVGQLTHLRNQFTTLQAQQFSDGGREVAPGLHEVDWFDERGQQLSPEDWENPEARALVLRRARKLPLAPGQKPGEEGVEATLFFLNGDLNPLNFNFPADPSLEWHCLLDSARPGEACRPVEGQVEVQGKSVMLFANRPSKARHG
ncbi:MAG: glycogen debranching protein GlgX [Polaromonas sp.]|nr:glycogen debranching protein GlgX [Polaromonas sp.]